MPQRRADRQEHLRLARPAVASLRPADPHARRDPRRGARHARRLGRHRALADRPVGALEGVRSGSSGCAATPTRSPRPTRSTTTGSPRTSAARAPARTCASAAGRAASGSRATWSPTTWASIRAGSSSTRTGSCRCRSRRSRRTRSTARTCRRTSASGSCSRTTTGTTATPRSCSSGRTAGAATTRYVYHGNDGTSFPWNDTAQLDFLKAEVREQVIQTILDVARRFPIIRFDAAMVLAEARPAAVVAGAGPAGAASRRAPSTRMTKAEFEALMPQEFWREVVDRVAAEVPGTLLLAEAFWMLEGYFVRTLGMHRVYNSAFMHMLRDEDGAGYRRVIKDTLEFDPEILKRYVNFMSNPDEETAVEQFGKGDKYFGVATLMATLPGLPMLGHGQVEGFGEKYGMEFRRATLDEHAGPVAGRAPRARDLPAAPPPDVVRRGERLPAVRLRHRRRGGRRARLRLLERERSDAVARAVPRPLRGRRPARSATPCRVREDPGEGAKRLVRRSLADGLGLPNGAGDFVVFRDARTGLEYAPLVPGDPGARPARHARRLRGPRLLGVPRGPRRVARASGRGWPRRSADRASRRSRTRCASSSSSRSTRRCGRSSTATSCGRCWPHGPDRADLDGLETRFATFLTAIATATGVPGDPVGVAASVRERTERGLQRRGADPAAPTGRRCSAGSRCRGPGELAPGADVAATSRAWFDELRLIAPLAAGYRRPASTRARRGRSPTGSACCCACRGRPRSAGPERTADTRLLDAWLADDAVRAAIGVNTWEGVEWLDRDRFARPARLGGHAWTPIEADAATPTPAVADRPAGRGRGGRLPRRAPARPLAAEREAGSARSRPPRPADARRRQAAPARRLSRAGSAAAATSAATRAR